MPKKSWPLKPDARSGRTPGKTVPRFDLPPEIAAHLAPVAATPAASDLPPIGASAPSGDTALPLPGERIHDQSIILGDSGSREALRVLLDATAHIKQLELLNHLKVSLAKLQAHDYKAAGDAALAALNVDEKNATAWHILAVSREKSGDLKSAFASYEAALSLDPDNIGIANDVGRLAFFMGLHDNAEQFFRFVLRRDPNHLEAVNNYASSLREMSRYEDAIEVIRPVLEAQPNNAALWNTLGTVVNAQGDLDTALLFFDEALKHDASNGKIWHNRGLILSALGRINDSITSLDEALKRFKQADQREAAELAQAFNYLIRQDFTTAWAYYEARKQSHDFEGMKYIVDLPPLDLTVDNLHGKSLFVSTEQGLGDEILFATLLPELLAELGPDGHLTLAVERRFVSLFRRSFPEVNVISHVTYKHGGYQLRHYPDFDKTLGYDGFAILGDFLPRYRKTIPSFSQTAGFLTPDPERVAHWKAELDKLGPVPKVGLLWKSLVKHSRRDRYYSPFDAWKPILRTPGVVFVNLQYGDVSEELAEALRDGISLWTPPGIDLKQDLDDLAALCAAMDLIIGPANATSNIAAGVGTPIWMLMPPSAWTMLGTDYYPWYPSARTFVNPTLGDWTQGLAAIHQALIDEVAVPVETASTADIAQAYQGLQRALLMRDWEDAEAQARHLTQLAPDHTGAWQGLATALDRLNRLPEALDAYQRALATDPESLDIANDVAQLAFRIGQYEMAERLYAHVIVRDPGHLTAVNYYAASLREQSKFDTAIEVLQRYLAEYPRQSELWDTLGTIVMAQGDLDTSLIFFNEAVTLDNCLPARFNRACAWMEQGHIAEAIPEIEICLDRFSEPSNLRSAELTLAYAHLSLGRFKEGWDAYEARHMVATPQEVFHNLNLPRRCAGSMIDKKRLLIVFEQGLGDEVMFGTLLPDIMRKAGQEHLTIAVEPRLVPLFTKAFPAATVLAHATETLDGQRWRSMPGLAESTIDEWALIGDFLKEYRNNLTDFGASGPYLKPDPERVAFWQAELARQGNGRKIGLLWKSLKNDSRRARYYSALGQWQPLLSQPGHVFVNLQYGDTESDLAEADAAGFNLYTPPIDLMNDLDELSAICAAMDLIIGPSNATSQIAAATGAPVWLLLPPRTWPMFGTDHYPWYPNVRVFEAGNGGWDAVLARVADAVRDLP